MDVHAIQERHSVLTNQCLGKETNAEPLGRGTEGSFLMDSDKFIVIRNLILSGEQRFSPATARAM